MLFILSGEIDSNTSANKLSIDYANLINFYFKDKSYSPSISRIFIIYVCRPFKFNTRKKYTEIDTTISHDILLDYLYYVHNSPEVCKRDFFEKLYTIIPFLEKLSKTKIRDFKVNDFKQDLKIFVEAVINNRLNDLETV